MSELKGKTVGILVEEQYQDQEVWYPYYRLLEAGARVVVIGSSRATSFKSKHGYPIEAAVTAAKIDARTLDGVIVPGGFAPDFMRRDPAMVKLVHDVYEQGGIVAAICHGAWLLCSAKILQGKTITSFFAIRDDVEHAGATWVNREVSRDGQLVTARQPEDLPAFMKTLLEALAEPRIATRKKEARASAV
ncbi:MAG: type 1 glutamine amidotransferase [Candidatus Omnitrophica bacterium]|nr:type 1 glutamine amidotransferase [Candidatus Omnitrophota bacterium]